MITCNHVLIFKLKIYSDVMEIGMENNLITRFIKTLLPLLFVITIIAVFFMQIACGSEGDYIFRIENFGKKLEVISGMDFLHKNITISNHTIQMDDMECLYAVNKNNDGFSIYLLLPNGEYLTHKFIGSSFVKFNNSFMYNNIAYEEGKGEVCDGTKNNKTEDDIKIEGNEFDKSTKAIIDRRFLLVSAILVNLRVLELYTALEKCLILIAVIIFIGYYSYLKPKYVYEIYCKLRGKEKYMPDMVLIKRISFIVVALSPLMLFLLIL